MSRTHLFIVWLPVFFVISWHHPVCATQRVECCNNKGPTHAITRLKDGDFIRVQTVAKREVSGYFRSFDGSRLVIEHRGNLVSIDVADIVVIKRGRGYWGSIQKGFSRAGRTLARPVTEFIVTYQMMKWFNEAP